MTRLSQLSRSIEGKSALITGAASGMGRAMAELFADEGAQVAVTDLSLEATQPVVTRIREAGGRARAWALDVTDPERIEQVIAEIDAEFGGLDILINNAGIATVGPIDMEGYEEVWQRAFDVLLTAHVRLIRAALPLLERSGTGRIVNIASTEGLGATAGGSPYTVAKHGVVGLTRSMACELGPRGITVNCICPGPIETGMTQAIPADAKKIFAKRRVPLRRYGVPEEIAHGALNFVLPASSFINGAVMPIDGGLTIKFG